MIRLYDYWRSSSAYRVRIGLNLLGLDYQSVPVDLLAGEQASPANLARNPQGVVPTLDIDGLRLTQSLAILEYLNDTRNTGWLPEDPGERARLRALAMAVAMEIQPVCNLRVARMVAESGGMAVADWMQHHIFAGLQAVEAMLDHPQTGPFAHGARMGLADICLLPQVYNARRWGVGLDAFARLQTLEVAAMSLPAVQAAHPDALAPVA